MTRSEIRWAVLRDRYPFGIGAVLGFIQAPDRPSALAAAATQFMGRLVVQSVASLNISQRELQLPAADPGRDACGLKARGERRRYQRERYQGDTR